jgi:hypothetical protein
LRLRDIYNSRSGAGQAAHRLSAPSMSGLLKFASDYAFDDSLSRRRNLRNRGKTSAMRTSVVRPTEDRQLTTRSLTNRRRAHTFPRHFRTNRRLEAWPFLHQHAATPILSTKSPDPTRPHPRAAPSGLIFAARRKPEGVAVHPYRQNSPRTALSRHFCLAADRITSPLGVVSRRRTK